MSKKVRVNARVSQELYDRLEKFAIQETGGNLSLAICAAIERLGPNELHDYADADADGAQHSAGASFVRRWWRGGGDG